ncbi:MAG: hypothetical protein WCA08_01780 [Desulfoferrobacter sp.]
MRKGAIIAVVLILVAAIILALALLGQTRKQKDIIADQEKQLARLNSELEQSNEKEHSLQQRALKSSEEVRTATQRNATLICRICSRQRANNCRAFSEKSQSWQRLEKISESNKFRRKKR